MIGRVQGNGDLSPEYEVALKGVPIFGYTNQVFDVAIKADFFLGRFSPNAEELSWNWAPIYVLEPASLVDLFQRIREIGQIFEVGKRAEAVLADLSARLNRIESRLIDYEPVKALVYDRRADGIYVAGGTDIESRLLDLAGGENVFADLKGWSQVTAGEILARQPEAVIVLDNGPTAVELKVANLKADPTLAKLEAIKDGKIIALSLDSLESGLRAAQAVEALARFFHPSLF
jgi:iron complex transport system substrate-binding protein